MIRAVLRKSAAQIGLLGIGVFLSRLPFLEPGYGSDPDAWRMAQAARHFATTGEYIVSRLPGYPLPETVMAAFWDGGPFIINGLTALMSAIAAVFFALIMRHASIERYIWVTIAFAATPVIFVNSVVAMDYLWAVAFVLAAVYFAMRHRWTMAGVMLGLAVGCRMTSVVIGLPLLLFLILEQQRPSDILRFVASSVAVAALAWSPVFYSYGLDFFTFYGAVYPDAVSIVRRITLDIFGRLGVYAIILTMVASVLVPGIVRQSKSVTSTLARNVRRLSTTSLAVFVLMFLFLPHEPAYLIPAVPFFLIRAAMFLKPLPLGILCACISLASFIHPCTRAIVCDGAMISSIEKRQSDLRYVEGVLAACRTLPPNAILACAWWQPMIDVSGGADQVDARLIYLLDSSLLRTATDSQTPVYYLNDVVSFNRSRYGIDLEKVGSELKISEIEK